MKQIILIVFFSGVFYFANYSGQAFAQSKKDHIQYSPFHFSNLSDINKQALKKDVQRIGKRYDPDVKMLTDTLSGWNYHTDAESGVYHGIRDSFWYAAALLDIGGSQNKTRAFAIIRKTLSLQATNPSALYLGVWPYYMEEPLATKKSPVDYNWADFNSVTLLHVFMGHRAELPEKLKSKIRNALILASRSIQKRNVGPSYTNISFMGAYVTYITSHLFDMPDMQKYAKKRIEHIYDYTTERGGFNEYNSPTYTIVALDIINRMQQHIIDPDLTSKIDSLYDIGWDMIARHYHKPTGQWTGPQKRAYHNITRHSFYGILNQASNGKIDLGYDYKRSINKITINYHMPDSLLHYFLSPQYPRTVKDVFVPTDPIVTGTDYMTDEYAVSTANRSSMWNQRRPFLAHWGTMQNPHYLQVRFLHNSYDFSSATIYNDQEKNKILSAINFILHGGDKHISIDRIKDGTFKAKDLRVRFEFGNTNIQNPNIPNNKNDRFSFVVDNIKFNIQLFLCEFEGEQKTFEGHWEKGGNGKKAWIDYVIYDGPKKEFDLNSMKQAILGFTFSMGPRGEKFKEENPEITTKNGKLHANWKGLDIRVPIHILPQPKHL